MAELVKLRLPNGNIIERPRKVAKLFIRGGAEEILPALKPKEVLTKTNQKTPPPIILKEPDEKTDVKPDEYPAVGSPDVGNKPDTEAEKQAFIASLKRMNKDKLVEVAKDKKLPEDQWLDLTKPKLVEYLTGKV